MNPSYNPQSKKILVTGASNFLPSNLIDHLLQQGHRVVGVDTTEKGLPKNLRHLAGHSRFQLVCHNLQSAWTYIPGVDQIYHFPSSSATGREIEYLMRFAKRHHARVLLASSMGDEPLENIQCHTNGFLVVGLTNTYGPRMTVADNTLMTSFITAALMGKSISISGDSGLVQCFQYVDDAVAELYGLMNGGFEQGVFNVQSMKISIEGLAETVADTVANVTGQTKVDVIVDGEGKKCSEMEDGLRKTIEWFIKKPSEFS